MLTDVEQATVWARAYGDVVAKSGHPQTSVIAQIVDILMTNEEEFEPT